MVVSLFQRNRLLLSLALFVATVLLAATNSSTSIDAAGAVTSVRLRVDPRCNPGSYTLKIGGTTILSGSHASNCGCANPILDVSTNNPSLLALVNGPGCTDFTLSATTNDDYITWARVDVVRTDGTEAICMVDNSGSNSCATATVGSCNYTYYPTAPTFIAGPGDTDGDGQNNCVDADIDGDGVLNAADNCPYVANPTQTDTDSNGVGDVCQPTVVAVPWLGNEALPHQVYSGGQVVLQAVASQPADGTAVTLSSATWDPGDGSGPQSVSASNSLALELTHTYSGADGQPFTATVSTVDQTGHTYTDTFKIVIKPNSRETKVNMAIDKGLWNLHKALTRLNGAGSDGLPSGYWTYSGGNQVPATSSAVQAFEINNHRESGDRSQDPYLDDVARGLRYLFSASAGKMLKINVPTQNGNNPDANGNGYGLTVNDGGQESYVVGQVMDAIVASGTPNKTAETGITTFVRGRTYKDIVQDLIDGYSYGMSDDTGGWYYTYQATTGVNDTSASHWWGIGTLASHTWGLDAPTWVKNIAKNTGLPLMQSFTTSCPSTAIGSNGDNGDGHFGYASNYNGGKFWAWDNGTNTTAAGLILMNAEGVAQTDARFSCASKFLAERYTSSLGNFYTMYQTTKGMRTAINSSGVTTPITLLNGTRDWYAGYADYLIANQAANGSFSSNGTAISSGDMATAWAIIILSPSLFTLPPTASCTANPATIGTHGGVVNFDASASFSLDPSKSIASYSWDFGDASASGSGVTTSHNYSQPASFPTTRNAQVTVTDSSGLTATSACPVTIVNTNVPPNANTGGPYTMCVGTSLTLNGSTSSDEDGTIASYSWDWTLPITFTPADASSSSVDVSSVFNAKGPGIYDVGLKVTDNDGASNSEFTTVTVLAANNPSCNQPPVATNDTATTFSGTPVTITVLANDTDPDSGQTLTVTGTSSGPTNGGAVVNGNNTVTYTPNLGFAGTDAFTYSISDGHGGTASATVTVTVNKRTATVTAGGGTKIYGTALDPALSATTQTGFLAADVAGITLASTRATGETVGSYATTATATGGNVANYAVSYVAGSFTITPAASTTVVNCTPSVPYTGSALEVCTATVTGAGGLNAAVTPVTYNANTNVGTAGASATYAGDANHSSSTGTGSFAITLAASTTVVTCTPSVPYTGSALEVCTAAVTGVGGLNEAVTPVSYSANTNVGTAGASATYAGDANHSGSTGTGSFAITSVASTTVVSCTPSVPYTGSALEVCTATVTGTGGLNQVVTPVTYSANTNVGTAGASATYAGDANHSTSTGTGSFAISPAASATVVSCTPSVPYTGSALEVCTATVTGAGGLNQAVTPVSYSANTNVGTAGANATYAGDANHNGSSGTGSFAITPAASTTVVTCTPSVPYTGSALEVCTANVTGAGGLNQAVTPVTYSANTNVGTAGANATYPGDANHNGSSGTGSFAITPVASSTVVTCSPSATYTGSPVEVCSATVTGVGGLNQAVTPVTYSANTNVGTAGANATYAGDTNHNGSTGTGSFAITPATSTTAVTCTPSVHYTGSALEVCTATVTGAGGLNQAVTPVTYSTNTNVGTAGASATYAGDANHNGSSGTGSFAITPATTTTVVTCTPSVAYTGVALEVCTASVTGAGGLSQSVTPVTYSSNTNAGTAGASATYSGDANHSSSTGTSSFAITQATSTTVVTCTPSVAFTGSALEVCTANVTGVGGLNQAVTPVTYSANTNVGTAGASATYAGDPNHSSSAGTSSFAITLASSTTVVTCTPSVTYTGSALEVCTANVTGIGGLNHSVTPVTYSGNVDVGTAGASATFAGDANHASSTGTGSFTIIQKPVTVTAGSGTKVYGNPDPPLTPTTPSFGAGITISQTPRDAGENVGNYKTHAIASGPTLGNYAVTYVDGNLTITQRPVTVTADAQTKVLGAVDPPLTYQVTSGSVKAGDSFSGALGRVSGEAVGSYAIQQNTLTLGGNYALAYTGANLSILYSTGACLGAPGHEILQPINADGTSVFQQKSTVPAKFRVCNANGQSIGTPGTITSFRLVQTVNGTVTSVVDEAVDSTTPDVDFRWTGDQWIFNMATKNLQANRTYYYRVTLNDGSFIDYHFGLK